MSTLKEKAETIATEKTEKIIPENIKSGITIFDITGTYAGGEINNCILTDGFKFSFDKMSDETLPNWFVNADTSRITDFSYMFSDCESLIEIPQLSTSNGTNFKGMFAYCLNLTTIPQFDTSSGIDFESMFIGCQSLTEMPNLDTSNAVSLRNMFEGCYDISNVIIYNTSNVERMNGFIGDNTNLDNNSLNNILYMCANVSPNYTDAKFIGNVLSSWQEYQIDWTTLSNYQAFIEAGWRITP